MDDFTGGLRAAAATALFPTEGELAIHGLGDSVTVRRDRWGVPYIEAGSLDDLWFAQGLVTAGERLFQLDLLLRAANGRLSEVFAERTLAEDRFARTVGLHRAGATLAASWDEESRRMHERFRAGVFAWIESMLAAPVEYMLLDLGKPDLPRDDAAWAAAFSYLAWGLSGNWDTELLRAWIRERSGAEAVETLLPPLPQDPPDLPAGALHGAILDAMPRMKGRGSNNWAVAGSRTASGAPLLANDPHLQVVQPGVWLELHLSAPGYRARGVALTFSPGILLGATAHHAWGVTNVSGDVQDLYIEKLNEDRSAAEFDGEWAPLTIHREEIAVRGQTEAVVFEVRETRHGPLLDTFVSGELDPEFVELPAEPAYALRWTGHEHGIRPSLVLAAAAATGFDEFRAAAQGLECPGQNVVYADVDGTIGYACTGLYPVRRNGDGTAPVPGWTSEHEWDGFVPFDDLPWATDPPRGFFVTANNRIHDDAYPHLIGHDFHTPYRARRIAELLEASGAHDVGSMTSIQTDTVSLPARTTAPLLVEALEPQSDAERASSDLLRAWDGDMAAGSRGAAVFTVWSWHIARRLLRPWLGEDLFRHYHAWRETFQCEVLPALLRAREGPQGDGRLTAELLRAALTDAMKELGEKLGGDAAEWRWGALHRLRLAHPLAAIRGLDALFVAADAELGGDEQTVMQGGFDARGDDYRAAVIPSWRAVYDLGDLDRSVGVLPAGVSGNPASHHWNDQAPLWLAGDTHPLAFTRDAVDAATSTTLHLFPATISS